MMLKARFPVFLRECRPPGFRTHHPAVIFLDTSVEIAEVSLQDAPLALQATVGHVKDSEITRFEFRHMNGRFYRKSPMSIEDFEHEVLWQPWGRHDGLKKLLDEVYEEVLPYSDKTYPGMILKTLLGISKPIMNQLAFIDRSARTNIEGDNVGKVEAAKECYQEACSAFILIDGAVWHECREPLLVVDTDAASPHRGEVTIFAGELPEASPIIASGYPRSTSVLFPFNALDRVRAVAAGVSDVGASERRTDLSIDFIDSTAFAHDFPYIQDAIRVLCELVSDGDIPKYLLDQVAEFLADDANWTDETVEQILQDCIANSVVDSPMKRALGPVLDRLNNRPIEFTFETSQLGLPRPRI